VRRVQLAGGDLLRVVERDPIDRLEELAKPEPDRAT
jgi:hypothetical protein